VARWSSWRENAKAARGEAVRRQQLLEQVLKFSALGAVNFVLTFVVFTGLLKVLSLNYLVSLFVAWFVGVVFMYVTNFVWVFQRSQMLHFDRRFLKFVVTGIVSIILNMLALHLMVERYSLDAFLAQLMLMPFVLAFNFLAAKFVSFARGA
jgi:putative flippase GtrA